MKNTYLFLSFIIFNLLLNNQLIAQPRLWYQEVSATNINLDSASTVLAQIIIDAPTPGKVEVHFNGTCISDPGDLIVFGASNYPDWETNDGNTNTFALDSNHNRMSFSHTRVYEINSGVNMFYAVGQNYVCNNGSGLASVYGMLTVIFFPDSMEAILESKGFGNSGDASAGPVVLDSVTINPTVSGKAVVRFDGLCNSDEGDRTYLAASNSHNVGINDGSIFVETFNSSICTNDIPFSHTRVYEINPGSHTFYAVAENTDETDGSGEVYVYASLTVEFYPNSGNNSVDFSGVSVVSADLTNGPADLGMLQVNTPSSGKVLVNFDGVCVSDSGDRIILAASDGLNWNLNSGSVETEAFSSDINENSFSHSRVYSASSATKDVYAVGENFYESEGSGLATIFGSLTAIYFPDLPDAVSELKSENINLNIFPNPVNTIGRAIFNNQKSQHVVLRVFDITGREIKVLANGMMNVGIQKVDWTPENEQAGIYFLKMETQDYTRTIKFSVLK